MFFILAKAYILKGLVVAILLLPKKASSAACSCSFVCTCWNIRYPWVFFLFFFLFNILTVWRRGRVQYSPLMALTPVPNMLKSSQVCSQREITPTHLVLEVHCLWSLLEWERICVCSAFPWHSGLCVGGGCIISHVHFCLGAFHDTALYQLSLAC